MFHCNTIFGDAAVIEHIFAREEGNGEIIITIPTGPIKTKSETHKRVK
jgi:hypothetical protein